MIKEFDRQEIFNKAYLGLKSQGFQRSFGSYFVEKIPNVGCLYRGPNGRKCAVGHLIPDEAYSETLEGRRADSLLVVSAMGFCAVNVIDGAGDFLTKLQRCHDECEEPETMKNNLIDFARSHNLTVPED